MIIPISAPHIDDIAKIESESFSDPWSRQTFCDLLESPLAVCYAAVDDEAQYGPQFEFGNPEVMGYVIMYHVFSDGQILNIAVKNIYREQKIATQLLTALLDYSENTNIETFTLEVRKSNIPAISLYKKFGFEAVGVRKNYYRMPTEDAVLMTMTVK